ncbi:MAG: FKBP-type peptidyl-prolyl cis-trans isomerase [Rickettsiaceae bacterium]
MQKFLTLIISISIIYMIFQYNINDIKAPNGGVNSNEKESPASSKEDQATQAMTGNFVEKTISSVLVNVLKTDEGKMFFENILQPVNKPMSGSGQGFKINNDNLIEAMFNIKTFGEGGVGPATCGHVVTVIYKILSPNNMVISENTVTYPLGSNQIAPGVDAVIVGMKIGQTRHATISSKYTDKVRSAGDKVDSFKLNVVLKEIMPQNFIGEEVKIFDDEIACKLPLLCGGTAVYHAKITKLTNSEVVYDSKLSSAKINMQIGNLSYPLIFSYALHNKIPIGTRTVIAKGKLFKSFLNEFSVIFPKTKLPEDEIFMLELYDFENNLTSDTNNLLLQKSDNK